MTLRERSFLVFSILGAFLWTSLMAFSYVIGFSMIAFGLLNLRTFIELNGIQRIILFVLGSVLMYFGSFLNKKMNS